MEASADLAKKHEVRMKALVTYREAAELLSVSHWTVRTMVREGRLTATGEGKGRRVTMGSILRIGELDEGVFKAESQAAPADKPRSPAKSRPPGKHMTPSQTEAELDALLAPIKR